MANRHKCHLAENLLILVVTVSTLTTLPQLVSSQILDLKKLCIVGPKHTLQICASGRIILSNSESLVAVAASATNARPALLVNSKYISGQLPSDFGFSNLSYLALANNKLTGPIPPSVGHLHSSLIEMLLFNNQLSGCLPGELGMLSKAVVIDTGMNRLTGRIPPSLSCMSSVEQLNLAGNRLYGRVPDGLCKLAAGPAGRLSNLTLSGNYFTAVGRACAVLIKDGVLDVKNNCIPGIANQRPPAECAAFQRQPKTCPEDSTQQVIKCPAAVPRERKMTRDYYSYVTYASLHA